MPKVELNAALYLRLGALATKTSTIEMLVNRAVDEYLKAHSLKCGFRSCITFNPDPATVSRSDSNIATG